MRWNFQLSEIIFWILSIIFNFKTIFRKFLGQFCDLHLVREKQFETTVGFNMARLKRSQ
jgi:hypothetical protein